MTEPTEVQLVAACRAMWPGIKRVGGPARDTMLRALAAWRKAFGGGQ